jgi:hypothetical protein
MWTGHDNAELNYGREGVINGTRPEERKRKKKSRKINTQL